MPHFTIVKAHKKTIKKKRKANFVDSEKVINRPKLSKKRKLTKNGDDVCPSRHA